MSGTNNNDSASSWINQCQTIELLERQAIIKALRAISGQFKAIADTATTASGTNLVQEPEFNFPIKGGKQYVVEGYFMFTANASGGLNFQINTPNNVSGATFRGKVTTSAAGVVATVTLNDNASLNASIFSSAAAYDSVYVQGYLTVPNDDILTVSFAQNTNFATPTRMLRGSTLNLFRLSSSRRAPNVV